MHESHLTCCPVICIASAWCQQVLPTLGCLKVSVKQTAEMVLAEDDLLSLFYL